MQGAVGVREGRAAVQSDRCRSEKRADRNLAKGSTGGHKLSHPEGTAQGISAERGQMALEPLCKGGPGDPRGATREGVLAVVKASHKHNKGSQSAG